MARDVIVIGCGGGGAVVAKELAARGLDVLVLEAGPRHADPENEWARFENEANNILTGYFRWGPADRSKPAWIRDLQHNGVTWQLAGVGGTTQHYYGNCPRAMPGAFQGYSGADASAYDTDHLFPLTYNDMLPYYEWVEYTLPVQTAAMGTKEEVFLRGAGGIGLPHNTHKNVTQDSCRPQENAILQPGGNAGTTTDPDALRHPRASGCTLCGYCFEGCVQPLGAPRNLKAKRSTDNSYVPMMLTADCWAGGRAAELVTDAFVTNILTEEVGGEVRAIGVQWREGASGSVVDELAGVVVLCGGTTENPRLWLNAGLPNPNDWVGRGYTDHHFDWVIGEFDDYTGSSKGAASAARCDFPGKGGLEGAGLPPAKQAFATGFSDSGLSGFYNNGYTPPTDADTFGRMIGNAFGDMMAKVDNLLNVLVLTDDDVEPQNRVTLSEIYPVDEHGPVPKIFFDHRNRSARTKANRSFLTQKAVDLLRAAGATKIHHIGWPPLILHVQSTMRMGISADDSVLDSNAEARFVKRLFIADNSALANALGGPNPTLTTQALATRTAEKIFELYFGGDAWVSTEGPVSSIDDAVTQAVLDADCFEPSSAPTGVAPVTQEPLPTSGATGVQVLVGAAALAAREIIRVRSRNPEGTESEQP